MTQSSIGCRFILLIQLSRHKLLLMKFMIDIHKSWISAFFCSLRWNFRAWWGYISLQACCGCVCVCLFFKVKHSREVCTRKRIGVSRLCCGAVDGVHWDTLSQIVVPMGSAERILHKLFLSFHCRQIQHNTTRSYWGCLFLLNTVYFFSSRYIFISIYHKDTMPCSDVIYKTLPKIVIHKNTFAWIATALASGSRWWNWEEHLITEN